MIRVWRLCRAEHARDPLSGEGARRFGGRWNPKGVPVAYCAAHLSLACLENLVHADDRHLPDDLVAIAIDIPDQVRRKVLDPKTLPADWDRAPGAGSLKMIGNAWVAAKTEALLVVPSAVIPEEMNFLINPEHPDAARLAVQPGRPFSFDRRLGPPSRPRP